MCSEPIPAPLALSYGIDRSPYYMVLDPEGRLVAMGLTLDEVEPTLLAQLDGEGSTPQETPAVEPQEPAADAPAGPEATP